MHRHHPTFHFSSFDIVDPPVIEGSRLATFFRPTLAPPAREPAREPLEEILRNFERERSLLGRNEPTALIGVRLELREYLATVFPDGDASISEVRREAMRWISNDIATMAQSAREGSLDDTQTLLNRGRLAGLLVLKEEYGLIPRPGAPPSPPRQRTPERREAPPSLPPAPLWAPLDPDNPRYPLDPADELPSMQPRAPASTPPARQSRALASFPSDMPDLVPVSDSESEGDESVRRGAQTSPQNLSRSTTPSDPPGFYPLLLGGGGSILPPVPPVSRHSALAALRENLEGTSLPLPASAASLFEAHWDVVGPEGHRMQQPEQDNGASGSGTPAAEPIARDRVDLPPLLPRGPIHPASIADHVNPLIPYVDLQTLINPAGPFLSRLQSDRLDGMPYQPPRNRDMRPRMDMMPGWFRGPPPPLGEWSLPKGRNIAEWIEERENPDRSSSDPAAATTTHQSNPAVDDPLF